MDAADDEKKARGLEFLCIDATEEREVQQWSLKLGCTPDELRAAVRTAGTLGTDVEKYLKLRN